MIDVFFSYLGMIDIATVGVLFAISCFVILVLGMTNRVVIFSDLSDLGWTYGIVLFPLAGGALASFAQESEQAMYIVSGLIILGLLVSIVKIYYNSIKANGIVVGLIIGTFKILTSFVMLLFALGIFSVVVDDSGTSLKRTTVFSILLICFGWLVYKMVNGKRVEIRRQQARIADA